jgi:hypothetical protein
MSQATYSRNPIVNAAVAVNSTATSGAIYTAPANGYARVQATLFAGNYATSSLVYIVVGSSATTGVVYWINVVTGTSTITSNLSNVIDSNNNLLAISNGAMATVNDIMVGPGQSIYVVRTTSGAQTTTGRVLIYGVEFKNG